jgi:extracellular factor (EF) 3-hydroxypalmitic acid methyl ester biosynthesis protein
MSPLHEHVSRIGHSLLADLGDVEGVLLKAPEGVACYEQLASAMDHCLQQLADLAIWGPENRVPSSELWNVAGHLLVRGWLQNQARMKPRGYAGDYEMLARIYQNTLCDDPLGRLFDQYFQAQIAPQAVRNRMRMMADWIVEGPGAALHVAVVGSAFGLDIRDALMRMPSAVCQQVRVTLLDLDPAAIEFARQQLSPLLPPEHLTAASANLFRLAERPQVASLIEPADLLFCPGMFDYLDGAAAIAMLRALEARLVPGGRLTIFQFAPHNPTRAYMEWLGNWYLTYRDAPQLRALVQAAGIPSERVQFGAEPLGMDLFATIVRPHDDSSPAS